MNNVIRKCTPEDLDELRKISEITYRDTFAGLNTEENMKAYLDKAFNGDKLRSELADRASAFYFIYEKEEAAGYIKLNESPSQTDIHDPLSLELERIYVLKAYQGKGLGRVLMNKAHEVAKSLKKTYLWLGVWEKNSNALNFYRKNGFYIMGNHAFVMGDEVQTDYLMRKDLE